MRFKSSQTGGYRVFAVTGTNTVWFAIDPGDADTDGLLGFAIERHDPKFNRLFNHYYFRSVQEVTRLLDPESVPRDEGTLFLVENDSWLKKYEPDQLRRKRVDVLANMSGFAPKT